MGLLLHMVVNSEEKVCNGAWTLSRFHSFIKSLLRAGTRRWAPIQQVKKAASTRRGFYRCAGYNRGFHEVTASIKDEKGKRVTNVFVDHVLPVVDPYTGFSSWDSVIERMFCEVDGLQVLCKECHDKKTAYEREIAKNRKKNNE